MAKSKASDLRTGNILRMNGQLVKLESITHRTPGNLRAFYQAKMRNLNSGKIMEHRFRPDEDIEVPDVETKNYQILYRSNDEFAIMDNETFDQFNVPISLFGESAKFIKDGETVSVALENGQAIMGEAPLSVVLEITYTEPAVKGDTATNAMKAATVETDVEIKVPLFVNQGDMVKVNTKEGSYIERVK